VTYIPAKGQAAKPLLGQLRGVLRWRNNAQATEVAYVNWVRRFIVFHDKRHPLDMAEEEIEGYLTCLADRRRGQDPNDIHKSFGPWNGSGSVSLPMFTDR